MIHEILSTSQPSPLLPNKTKETKMGVLGIPFALNTSGNDRQMLPFSAMTSGLIVSAKWAKQQSAYMSTSACR